MKTVADYLEQYALSSLEKQDKFSLLIGDFTFELDLEAGKGRFNGDLEFSLQVLGTESENTLTWLWAWADEQTEEIPVSLLRASRELRDWGKHAGIHEFTSPAVDLDRADGHVLAMISSELTRASCYFRDAYEGGAAFYLLFDARIDSQPSFDLSRLSRRFLDLISLHDFNHRTALTSYLGSRNIAFADTQGVLTARLDSGERLSAGFDPDGRLMSLNGDPVAA